MATGRLLGTLGIGLVAGFVGTAAITASQMVEMRLRKRKPSDAPAKAAEKVLHVHPESEKDEQRLTQLTHWAYGTGWGLFRPVVAAVGITGFPATGLHFAAIQGTAFVMLPAMKVAPPVKEWGATEIAVEMFHHAIYVAAAGFTYDALSRWLLTEALPGEAAAVAREQGRVPFGAIAATIAAMAVRGRRPVTARLPQPRFDVTWWQHVPEALRERVGEWERKLEGV